MPLTDLNCRAAKPADKRFCLTDGEGLYLEVLPSHAKQWRLKYRFQGKERRVTLGSYPQTTLLEARKRRESIKHQIASGTDPELVKLEKLQQDGFLNSPPFIVVAKEWHDRNAPTWDDRYARTVMHRLEKYVFDELGSYPIKLLKPLSVLTCLRKVDGTAPDMARRIKQLISAVFKYAIATGCVENDVTYGLELALKKYKKGHFAAIDLEELPDLLMALHNHKARLYHQTFLLIKLMLLTFCRTGELIQARWAEIDMEKALWIIPAERMKMRNPHLVPLSKQALAILAELHQMNGKREYVFPSIPRPSKPMSNGTILVALKRMGYGNRMTGHGFRTLALGILKEKLGYSHEVADRQLAHVPKSSTDRAYDRAKFLEQRKTMMQAYADYLDNTYLLAMRKVYQASSV
jgi:integrase